MNTKTSDDGKKPISKEKMLQVADIDTDKIENMNDEQLLNYSEFLRSAVNIFPVQKERLENALKAMDYASVMQWLTAIRNNLSRMQADDLARDCDKQLNINKDLTNIRHEALRAFVEYFLSNCNMFFTDVQKVLNASDHEANAQISEEDRAKALKSEIIEKLSTITELNHEKIAALSSEQLIDYIEVLNTFEDDFLTQSAGLRNTLKVRSYSAVIQWLTTIEETLVQIYAESLAEDCRNQININQDFSKIRHEKFEIFANYFLTSLSMLASDIKALQLNGLLQKDQQVVQIEPEIEIVVSSVSPENSKTILAINKMRILLKNLKVALDGLKYNFIGVTSLESLAGYLKTAKPDLILLDDDFPDMDGCDFAEKIRELGHPTPIIFLTSNITKEYMVKAIAAGVSDFIIKPVSARDVRDKVEAQLK